VNQAEELRRAVEDVLDPTNHWQANRRLIQCTPVFGDYEKPAYWMIVLDGSPPKAAILVQTGWNQYVSATPHSGQPMPIRIASDGTTKKLSTRAAEPLNALLTALYDKLMHGEKVGDGYLPSLVQPRAFSFTPDGTITEIEANTPPPASGAAP